jgi:hypothetical protein
MRDFVPVRTFLPEKSRGSQWQPQLPPQHPPPVMLPLLDVPELAIADATADALSPLLARAANVDISRVSFEP